MEPPTRAERAVIGHCVHSQGSLLGKAVTSWSTPLFNALVSDDLRALEHLLASESLPGEPIVFKWCCESSALHSRHIGPPLTPPPPVDRGRLPFPSQDEEYLVLCWAADGVDTKKQYDGHKMQVQVQGRTLLQVAVANGAMRCTSLLLARGGNPNYRCSGDGLSAYDVSLGREGRSDGLGRRCAAQRRWRPMPQPAGSCLRGQTPVLPCLMQRSQQRQWC